MTTWLVAHDFSPCARGAVVEAAKDLSARGGTLLLLHVYQVPRVPKGFDREHFEEVVREDASYQLGHMADELARDHKGVTVETMVRFGPPAETILEVAADQSVSRIVVGTHSRSETQAELLGSVAQRVMRHATVPVLVVKTPS